ncbi:MAG: hypothetical protein COT84_06025 [Chlamydiae bacterium CG10_big_fil_rev_8_21_14_0_10_35_9]|nr:MAG: hypothetical protein COT84_06025 [Chlamydiae bacterium CG10_big_fil_rev_8_21_14_0_10_35_9]
MKSFLLLLLLTPCLLLSKTNLIIQDAILKVDIANDPVSRNKGLMFVKHLPEDEGMLFVFEEKQKVAFWMKNTLIPLSIGYFDENKKLLQVENMYPQQTRPLKNYPSKKAIKYALEVNIGWFEKNEVPLGSYFSFE